MTNNQTADPALSVNINIGRYLKTLRQQLGWSLDRCSSETGVSKAMLGQIERGESSPTMVTLWKIAVGCGVSLSSFLDVAQQVSGNETLIRTGNEAEFSEVEIGMYAHAVFPFDPRMGFELFHILLAPGCDHHSIAHAPGVIEHVIVLEGQMDVLVGEQWHPLGKGEAIRFAADQPHAYRNLHDEAAAIHNLIHYPPSAQQTTTLVWPG
ncbi:helix-turn-helix domain-containing protein [Pokkaliibacter plantistimulans]|uniref:helix-turn-helix domain-containing protein n=1 Tax=Pokkaliibacter plantistimulans TaxID=1635171 RepID=UPI001FB002B4|nr:XRE family transcriptional regulator [Pokkaliibacter plantistimulans]